MNKLSKLMVTLAVTVAASSSMAQMTVPPKVGIASIDEYRSHTFTGVYFCAITVDTMLLNMESGRGSYGSGLEKVTKCARDNKEQSREKLKPALEAVSSPAAQDALKTFHVALMTALDGLEPGMGERRFAYEVRTQQLRGEMQKAWNRFELELKL